MGNAQMLAIWGNPGAGKTVTAMKAALELSEYKKNVVLLMCDFSSPAPQTLQPQVPTDGKSLGDLLSLPSISQETVLSRCIPFAQNPYVSLLGYKSGDNAFTYAQYSKERAVDLLTLLRHCADYVLIDCSSAFFHDVLSTVALENADAVLRLCTCDLKSISYFTSSLPLLADGRFASGRHRKALSAVKPGQDGAAYHNLFGTTAYTLPFVSELEEQFHAARLSDELCTKQAAAYIAAIRSIVADLLLNNSDEAPNEKKTLFARREKPPVERKFKGMDSLTGIRPLRSVLPEPERQRGSLIGKLRKGGKQ